jgi:uncharacterized protein (DUF488 family)
MKRICTIGVYGAGLDAFLAALAGAKVDLVLDVRQRRGVRGAQYAWANAKRLEAELREAGIVYQHVPDLAPTTAMREAERDAAACHRSLIAARIARDQGVRIENLRP